MSHPRRPLCISSSYLHPYSLFIILYNALNFDSCVFLFIHVHCVFVYIFMWVPKVNSNLLHFTRKQHLCCGFAETTDWINLHGVSHLATTSLAIHYLWGCKSAMLCFESCHVWVKVRNQQWKLLLISPNNIHMW